jgi:hypothetical protein
MATVFNMGHHDRLDMTPQSPHIYTDRETIKIFVNITDYFASALMRDEPMRDLYSPTYTRVATDSKQ